MGPSPHEAEVLNEHTQSHPLTHCCPKGGGAGHSPGCFTGIQGHCAGRARTGLYTSSLTACAQTWRALKWPLSSSLCPPGPLRQPPCAQGKAHCCSLFGWTGEFNRPLHRRLLSTCLAKPGPQLAVHSVSFVSQNSEGQEGWVLEPKGSALTFSPYHQGSTGLAAPVFS